MEGAGAHALQLRAAALLALVAFASSACATWPTDRVERALYSDLARSVELSNDTGWVVDRVQLENNAEDAMRSVCQVEPAKRKSLLAWLDRELARAGGSASEIYRRRGHDLDAALDALRIERVRAMLVYADEHSAADCPFWLEPDPEFQGVQGDEGRLVVLAETMGYGSLIVESGHAALGGGGGGRVMLGYGFSPQLTLAIGAEVGGSGAFVRDVSNKRTIDTTFSAGVPVLLRASRLSRVLDLEITPTVRFNPGTDVFPPGVRVSVGGGFSAMRKSSFLPYGLLFLAYEFHPRVDGSAPDHSIQLGTRFGVDWDP